MSTTPAAQAARRGTARSDRHDRARRSCRQRFGRKHRQAGRKHHRYVNNGSRNYGEGLELLKEAVPGISRVLVLSYLADPIAPLQVAALDKAAPSLGVTVFVRDIRTETDLRAAFDAGARERVNGLLTTAESVLFVHRAQIRELAIRLKLLKTASRSLRRKRVRQTVRIIRSISLWPGAVPRR